MKIQNKNISTRIQLFALGVTMLIVTPGGAVQMNASPVMSTIVNVQQINKVSNKQPVNHHAERRIRDCSLGIPCKRQVMDHRVGREKLAAIAVMMRLGMQAKIK